ncbi:MAG TPA: FAD-binding protein, partial [Pseudomonadota bacterium]|nr:FAD-binding protein [Pseudomonadota bacterium]
MSQPAVAAEATASLLAELRSVLGPHRVSTRADDRAVYARDMWTRGLLAIAAQQPPGQAPEVIVWPETAEEVQAIVRIARRHGVPLLPFGAGSGVTGAAVPAAGSLVLDLKRMRALHIDAERNLITCEPGILGSHLEDRLNRRGLTLGHFPSSIMCSTVGGWLATRGAGQMSTKYGKVEDMVQSIEVVTGTGEHLRIDSGEAGGPDLLQLFIGSEGTLGIITRATFLARPVPAARRLRGYFFPDVISGCGAIRHLLQLGLRPAVVRLYDELDTLMSGAGRHRSAPAKRPRELEGAASFLFQQLGSRVGKLDLGSPNHPPLELEDLLKLLKPDAQRARSRVERWLVQAVLSQAQPLNRLIEALMPRLSVGCLLILGFEGEPELATTEDELARSELLRLGARDLGEEPGEHWLRHRYDVSFKLPKAFAAGAFADTIEVATTWDRLAALYREVRAALSHDALVMAHFSHAYPDGCSIYFTFIGRALSTSGPTEQPAVRQARLAADQRRYDGLWQGAVQAALRVGATISHHHGIGKLRTPFMATEHGPSLGVLRALKRVYDPDWLCNPGKLLTDRAAPPVKVRVAPPPAAVASLSEPLRALLGLERVEQRDGALRCSVRSTAEVQAVVRLAAAHGVAVSCGREPGDGASSVQPAESLRVDLSGLSQVAPVRGEALLVEAHCGITLWQLEQGLRNQGLTLGALPP